jgi:hypothetical protein
MRLVYMAHPFRGDLTALSRARRWYRWLHGALHASVGGMGVLAPWIVAADVLSDVEERAAAMECNVEVVRRCDVVVLVGGEISPGMRDEAGAARAVLDLTSLGLEPPGGSFVAVADLVRQQVLRAIAESEPDAVDDARDEEM